MKITHDNSERQSIMLPKHIHRAFKAKAAELGVSLGRTITMVDLAEIVGKMGVNKLK